LIRAAVVVAGAALMPAAATAAGNTVAVLLVSAQVRPSAVFKFDVKTSRISVSEADIAAGYIELPASSLLSMKTPGLDPVVVVDFTPVEGLFKSVEVKTSHGWRLADRLSDFPLTSASLNALPASGAGKPAALAPMVEKLRPVAETGEDLFTAFSYRFHLGAKIVPRSYRVPMTLNINL
jgi:hypothetical protein